MSVCRDNHRVESLHMYLSKPVDVLRAAAVCAAAASVGFNYEQLCLTSDHKHPDATKCPQYVAIYTYIPTGTSGRSPAACTLPQMH